MHRISLYIYFLPALFQVFCLSLVFGNLIMVCCCWFIYACWEHWVCGFNLPFNFGKFTAIISCISASLSVSESIITYILDSLTLLVRSLKLWSFLNFIYSCFHCTSVLIDSLFLTLNSGIHSSCALPSFEPISQIFISFIF